MNTCPMCGAEPAESGLKFCAECGTPLMAPDAAAPAAAGPAAAPAPAPTVARPTPEPAAAPDAAALAPPLRPALAPQPVLSPERIPPVMGMHGFRFVGRRRDRVLAALWVFLALVVLAGIGTGIYYLVEAVGG